MNFYKHYIGDFQRDTGHLSLTERGAYLCLMHHYYATEKPLPNDHGALCRIAGAIDKAERQAVRTVMSFFRVVDSGLLHDRIEAELHKAGEISNTNRDIALAREAARRAEKAAREEHEACTKRAQSVPRTAHEQSTHQTPDTSNTVSEAKASSSAEPTKRRAKVPTIPCPYDAIVDAYHEALPSLPRVKLKDGPTWTDRQKAMRSLWGWVLSSRKSDGTPRASTGEQALDWIAGYFGRAAENDFVMGRTHKSAGHEGWRADFDFLLSKKGMKQVIEKTQEAA